MMTSQQPISRSDDWEPKIVVFDLLTALLDSWSVWNASTPSQSAADGRRWRERYLELTYTCGAYKPYEDLVQQSAKDVGLPLSAPAALLRGWSELKPWPEASEVLVKLKRKGYALGVVTNCSTELGLQAVAACCRAVKAATGFDFEFDAVVTAEECGFYKPNPKPYQDLLAKGGWRAGDALFVAGSASDVPGASGVGMRVVWHNRIGLARKGKVEAWKEGGTLDEVLGSFISSDQQQ